MFSIFMVYTSFLSVYGRIKCGITPRFVTVTAIKFVLIDYRVKIAVFAISPVNP